MGEEINMGDFLGKETSDEEMEVRAFSAGCLLGKAWMKNWGIRT